MDSSVSLSGPLWEEGKRLFYEEIGEKKTEKLSDSSTLEQTIKSLREASTKAAHEYGEHSLRIENKKVITIKLGKIMKRLEILLQIGDSYMSP